MDIIITFFIIAVLNFFVFNFITKSNELINKSYLALLFFIHVVLSIIYIVYATATSSDSFAYYKVASNTENWSELMSTGSSFIRFLAWPFCNALKLSYFSVMVIFSYIGFIGILLFYYSAKENITPLKNYKKLSSIELVFLLPNLHFWSASLGKGSVMMFALGILFFGLSRFNNRYLQIILGSAIVYCTRPHILFTCILGIGIGVLLSGKNISKVTKSSLILVSVVIVYFLTDKVLEFTDTDSLNILNSSTLSHKAQELAKSSSGVDISNYDILSKMLTFWFRPLFIDATGLMGILVSFENVILIAMFISSCKIFFSNYKKINGYFISCLFAFFLGSFALAQVSGNLGVALRQKAQLMPLFFIIYAKLIAIKQEKYTYA